MRISDWSSDVCSSDLERLVDDHPCEEQEHRQDQDSRHEDPLKPIGEALRRRLLRLRLAHHLHDLGERAFIGTACHLDFDRAATVDRTGENPALRVHRSEEHTSELQSLMSNSYAVLVLKNTKLHQQTQKHMKN